MKLHLILKVKYEIIIYWFTRTQWNELYFSLILVYAYPGSKKVHIRLAGSWYIDSIFCCSYCWENLARFPCLGEWLTTSQVFIILLTVQAYIYQCKFYFEPSFTYLSSFHGKCCKFGDISLWSTKDKKWEYVFLGTERHTPTMTTPW